MGLRLPIYPYYAAMGMPGVKEDPASFFNRRAFEEMQQFADYLCKPTTRQIASNIIPPRGTQRIPTKGWFETAVFDKDDWNHKELAALMAAVGSHGTILVPDLTHIMGKKRDLPPSRDTRNLMARFDIEDIEVLPLVLNLPGRRYDLRQFSKPSSRKQSPAPELFELMPEIARATVDYLKRYVVCGSGKRTSPKRRQLVPERPRA
jgi:hypothetical protein